MGAIDELVKLKDDKIEELETKVEKLSDEVDEIFDQKETMERDLNATIEDLEGDIEIAREENYFLGDERTMVDQMKIELIRDNWDRLTLDSLEGLLKIVK